MLKVEWLIKNSKMLFAKKSISRNICFRRENTFILLREVLIIPDKDMTGHQYALKVKDAFNLLKPKTSIFMCDMPEAYKDVSEFFEAGKKISELKKYISVHAVIYPSQIEPTIFFADRNIVIPDWHQKGNDRRQFIKEIYASIFNLIKDWHDIFNFQIDKIDQIASQNTHLNYHRLRENSMR